MLYQRYANPLELLDGMLMAGQMHGFVSKIIDMYNDEMEEKTNWEYWLHKDWERSWPEFLQALNDKPHAAPTQQETLEIVKESMSIMASFDPAGGGAECEHISDIRGNSNRRDEGEQNP